MPSGAVIRLTRQDEGVAAASLRAGIAQLQAELKATPDFPPEVLAEAERSAATPRLPERDETAVPFVTLDPLGSRDLDQAFHLSRSGDGYLVRYAIADVAAFVASGGVLDAEAHARGETMYGADSKVPLHPPVLSEGAASLLPGETRPALLWEISLDAAGELTGTAVGRALVRSRAQLDYAGLQRVVDAGGLDGLDPEWRESVALLGVVGPLRQQREAARGGVSLPLPEQEIEVQGDRWTLSYRRTTPVEDWNAQLSLLTGMAAGAAMVAGGIGLLRTVPPADPRDVDRLRRIARTLGQPWGEDQPYPDFVRGLDAATPRGAALALACARLFRGSGYAAFDGTVPELTAHAAVAAPYAHVTAPLRRLGDRYAGEIALALLNGAEVPGWVRAALPGLPETLRRSASRSGSYSRGVTELVEAGVLAPLLGQALPGAIVSVEDKDPTRGTVTVREPAVEAKVTGESPLPLGQEVAVTVAEADVATRTVSFRLGDDRGDAR